MTEWKVIEIFFGKDKITFVRDLPPKDHRWTNVENWASSILDNRIERKVRNAFLLFSRNEYLTLCYLKQWAGRKYRYFIRGGLLRIFLVYHTGRRPVVFEVQGEDPLCLFSDCGYRPFQGAGFENGTAVFPARYYDPVSGKHKKIRIMLRVSQPKSERKTKKGWSVPVICGGREIARGHFSAADQERFAMFSGCRCELIF